MKRYWPLAALSGAAVLLILAAANSLITVATNDPRDYAPYLRRSFLLLALSVAVSLFTLAAARGWPRWAAAALLLANAYFGYLNILRVPYVWP